MNKPMGSASAFKGPALNRALASEPRQQIHLMGELIPRGDGTYTLKPALPDSRGKTWIDTADAVKLSGQSPSTLYRWAEVGLVVFRRPTPVKWEFELGSLQAMLKKIEVPEFWTNRQKEARAMRESRR
jgi:hypothetical protein